MKFENTKDNRKWVHEFTMHSIWLLKHIGKYIRGKKTMTSLSCFHMISHEDHICIWLI